MLDAYDRKILFILEQNARESYTQIAKKVGLSKDSIRYRIQNLESKKIIDGYYARVNASKLGFIPIRFYCNLRLTTQSIEESIIHYLKRKSNVWWLAQTQGFCDIAGGVWVESLQEFQKFWQQFRTQYAKYVTNPRHGIFIELREYPRRYLVKSKMPDYISINFSEIAEDIN